MADYDNPRPTNPVGSTDLSVAKDNLITHDLMINSEDATIITRFGKEWQTLVGISQSVSDAIVNAGGQPLNDGAWADGQTFTAYNQYMIYNGIAYKPLSTTTLPYGPTGTEPDGAFVGPFSEYTDEKAAQGEKQQTNVQVYPSAFDSTASTSEPNNSCPVGTTGLRDAINNKIYKTSASVSGEITALDFNALTATIGGVAVTLTERTELTVDNFPAYLGQWKEGIEITTTEQWVGYGDLKYKITGESLLPYVTQAYDSPDLDPNLQEFVNVDSANLLDYAKVVYRASDGNSAVENMIAGIPVSASVGDVVSTGGTAWVRIAQDGLDTDFARISSIHTYDIATDDLEQLQKSMASGNAIAQPKTYSTDSPITDVRFGSLVGQGATITDINCTGTFLSQDGGRLDEIELRRVRIIGSGSDSGTVGVFMDGLNNTTREHIHQVRIQDFETGIELNSGWGRRIDQCFIANCGTGIGSGDSTISPSISGSGTTVLDTYVSGCENGINDRAQWNFLLINTIIENCTNPYIQNQGGNGRTLINCWFESNTNATQWRSGSVVINGRGVEFDDVDLFSGRPQDCIIWLDRSGGLRVFRQDVDDGQFWVDGEGVHNFQPIRDEVGFELIDNNEATAKLLNVQVGGGITSTSFGSTTDQVLLSKLTGKQHQFSSQIDDMPEVGFKVMGQSSSSGSGSGIVTLRLGSGRYVSGGGSGTDIDDRWELLEGGDLAPMLDDAYSIGASTERVSNIYLVNSPSVTSDDRYKAYFDISEAESRAASKIKTKKFKYNESIELKGSSARYHFGYSAQQIIEAFESEGLDPMEYALIRKVPINKVDIDSYEDVNIEDLGEDEFRYEVILEQVNAFLRIWDIQ